MAGKKHTSSSLPRRSKRELLSLEQIVNSRVVLETITDGFIVLSKKWEYLYINEEAEKLLEIKKEEIQGMNIWKRFPLLKKTKFYPLYHVAMRENKRVRFDEYSVRIDKWFHVEALPIREGLIVYFHDVTKQKKAEETLEYQRLLLEAQKEASPEGILIVSPEGGIISYNTRFATMWNLPKQVIDSQLDEVALTSAREHLVDPEGFIKRVTSIYTKRVKTHDILHFKDGRVFERHGFPVIGEENKYFGYIWFFLDISEQSELERKKDEFISMASHELNTPVTSLKMYTQLLQRKLERKGEKELVGFASKMDAQVSRLNELILDLLDLSRIQTGKLVYRDERFSLNDMLLEITEAMEQTSHNHITKLMMADTIYIKGDRNRIGQVIINLLSNAYKYSPKQTKVIVRLVKKHHSALISVQDFGIGIAKKHQAKIFERFYQVVNKKEKTFPGLGIGLHISYEIIRRHNGNMWVESKKGKGSTFFVSLPL